MNQVSRRGFLQKAGFAAVGAAALGTVGLVGCSSEPTKAFWMPEKWDEETDLVVVGYGASGVTAAITGVEEGLGVIVLEKSPNPDGGNFGCSTGQIQSSLKPNDLNEQLEKWAHFNMGAMPEDAALMYKTLSEHEMAMPDWLEGIGLELATEERDYKDPSRAIGTNWYSARGDGGGAELWANFHEIATDKGVDIRLATPAKSLIQNPETKEIVGVVAQDAEGNERTIKANKAVIMACGGFENNPLMQGYYTEWGVRLWPWGTKYNTGDGIAMCTAVGAQMWHLNGVEWGNLCYRLASEEVECAVTNDNNTFLPTGVYNFLLVNKEASRYICETEFFSHEPKFGRHHQTYVNMDLKSYEFTNMPFWLVFDQTAFEAGPIYGGSTRVTRKNSYCGVQGYLDDWNNEEAVQKGWIFKGSTIEELAAKIEGTAPSGAKISGLDPAALKATVDTYNGYAASGEDPEFARTAKTMAPVETGPFYAIEMALTTINTQGGPRRNEFCQSM
ncbi:MAG: FAD-dependent oxidoreductase, partial [Raoultibacter sp.]